MANKRTLIVGDVHGCFDELMELLEKVRFNRDEDRLILVGDLINKGPKSFDVLKWVRQNNIELVLGNHELGFLNFLQNPNPKYKNFVSLKEEMGEELLEWTAWLSSIPFFIEEESFIVVHGGVIPEVPLHKTEPYILTQIRTWDGEGKDMRNVENPPWYELYKGGKTIVYGHWAAKGLNIREKTIGLDSGCCFGKKLSLLHLETKEIVQVDAKEAYIKID